MSTLQKKTEKRINKWQNLHKSQQTRIIKHGKFDINLAVNKLYPSLECTHCTVQSSIFNCQCAFPIIKMPFTYKSKHCICCHKLLDAIENSANKTTSTFEIYYLAKSNVNLSSDNAMSASKTNTSKQSTTNAQWRL